mmetsp:Transcript_7683/g.19734  ORF Transcript_7683/g.19734 Transcript_7683/m.19734 type:complete len:215 (+) Transcript_7683:44-688(+)
MRCLVRKATARPVAAEPLQVVAADARDAQHPAGLLGGLLVPGGHSAAAAAGADAVRVADRLGRGGLRGMPRPRRLHAGRLPCVLVHRQAQALLALLVGVRGRVVQVGGQVKEGGAAAAAEAAGAPQAGLAAAAASSSSAGAAASAQVSETKVGRQQEVRRRGGQRPRGGLHAHAAAHIAQAGHAPHVGAAILHAGQRQPTYAGAQQVGAVLALP